MDEEGCYCEDFERAVDGEDDCVCGHDESEHVDGFFRTCIYNDQGDDNKDE